MVETVEPINYDALDALKSVLGLEFSDLIRDFRIQSADNLVRMELALSNRDCSRIQSVAHTIRGSALSLHCKPLAESCAKIERIARSADIAVFEELVDELRHSLRDTLLAIEVWAE